MVKALMSLHEKAKTKIRVELGLSEELFVKVGVYQVLKCHHCCLQWWTSAQPGGVEASLS